MAQIAAALGIRGRIRNDDIGTAAAVEFPDERAPDKAGASGHEDAAAGPGVCFFATRHIVELCAALLYSTELSPQCTQMGRMSRTRKGSERASGFPNAKGGVGTS